MSVERSEALILVGYFLARCGRDDPPSELGVESWDQAYAAFYDTLSDGRPYDSFVNTLKLTRDQYDSHVDSSRRGFLDESGAPRHLPERDRYILEVWHSKSDAELWDQVARYANASMSSIDRSVAKDVAGLTQPGEAEVLLGQEGKRRVRVSARIERSPAMRSAALRRYGYHCQVCGFDFEATYGAWGKEYAEVHHMELLAESPPEGRSVDPARDLVVLCSNCHRMIHREAGRVLSLDELRHMLAGDAEHRHGGEPT